MTFLEFHDVHKRYGDHEVLAGIDLSVEKHQVVTLIGASGSGKSTLLRCANALEPIASGEIRLDGDVVSGPGVDLNGLRQRVGMVFQSYNLFPHMTVHENITLGPRKVMGQSRAQARERADVLLERVGLADRAHYYPDQLSGGQQQRAAIVRSLAMDPLVVLLDEITSALDPELVAEVLSIVRELARDGMTMMIATHEMGFARDVADLVVFLDHGVIAEQGPPDQVLVDPVEPRTREFLRTVAPSTRGAV